MAGADLSTENRALLAYAEKLTQTAAAIDDTDLAALRTQGFDDAQLWEATFVTAFFNLVTRMADAFGIAPLREREEALGLTREEIVGAGG